MSPAAKRGLQTAKDLLRKELLARRQSRVSAARVTSDVELQAAIDWIAHQEAIDDKRRRRPRYLYPPR